LVDGEFVIDMRSLMAGDVSDEDQVSLPTILKAQISSTLKNFRWQIPFN
jgi:hypothetical protein